jgi:RNA polymerase sigma factor (sigma-70 family)
MNIAITGNEGLVPAPVNSPAPASVAASAPAPAVQKGRRGATVDPDLDIFLEIQRGNEQALVQLMERHRESLHRFIYRYTGHEQDSRELTEETFVRAWFAAPKFQPRAKIVTWLFTIASNLCHDRQRRLSRARLEPLEGFQPEDEQSENPRPRREFACPAAGVSDEADRNEMARLLMKAVHQLPHSLKVAFIPFALENRSYQECAELLGCSEKTIETRIYRAKRHLRGILKPAFDGWQE